jgi:hypothetical protein
MLRDEELKLDEFYSKAYFVTGHMRMRTLNSYIKVMKELECGRDGTVKLNIEKCLCGCSTRSTSRGTAW